MDLREAILASVTAQWQTTVQIHVARCRLQDRDHLSGTGGTVAMLTWLYEHGEISYSSGPPKLWRRAMVEQIVLARRASAH